MKARQNPLTRFEAFIQRVVEGPFARLFPSRLEPIEVVRKLERALEDNTLLQGEGRRLAPNIYDIYLSIKDHQQMSPTQNVLIHDWQNQLIEFARARHYTLRTVPIIRLHSDTSLRTGIVRIESELSDRQGGDADGIMATQALSAEQMSLIRAQMAASQSQSSSPSRPPVGAPLPSSPGNYAYPPYSQPGIQGSSPNIPNIENLPTPSMPGIQNNYGPAATIPPTAAAPAIPPARLIIRLPQANQQVYRIEKTIINIGRQLSNDIIVEDKRVSRYHAQIKYQPNGDFAIFDLGSTNGITINNVPHMRQHVLRNGDHFTIGSYDFFFERR